jgi:ribosomal RNA assembly protein
MTTLFVRVPDDRVAAIIGPGGATRREIEARTGAHVHIDTEEGAVMIRGEDGDDPVRAMKARDIVLAIGRGFSPQRAMRLLRDDDLLGVLDIKETTGKREKAALWRIRARIIGEKGRARQRIEELSGASMSVYGSTVALIGNDRQLDRATRAVRLLLRGSEHSTVFHMLARQRREDAFQDASGETEPPVSD